ncbi:hypothetical protein LZ31DRAFT_197917 [Colletotrichum somersetense]|nr:hypothetical protein LZ31DRAFT_197917 [Colletotrichum somersetense]
MSRVRIVGARNMIQPLPEKKMLPGAVAKRLHWASQRGGGGGIFILPPFSASHLGYLYALYRLMSSG